MLQLTKLDAIATKRAPSAHMSKRILITKFLFKKSKRPPILFEARIGLGFFCYAWLNKFFQIQFSKLITVSNFRKIIFKNEGLKRGLPMLHTDEAATVPCALASSKRKKHDKTRIRFRTTFRNVVHDVLSGRLGWKEAGPAFFNPVREAPQTSNINHARDYNVCVNHDVEWDLVWIDKEWMREIFDQCHFETHQRVNHFRNHYELTRKDMLIKNVKKTRRLLTKSSGEEEQESKQYQFIPSPSYTLPQEYSIFVEKFKQHPNGTQWIMKPVAKCQGKGIFLFTKLSDISDWKSQVRLAFGNAPFPQQTNQVESYVVQKYISNPLLIGGKKFDLRIYVLVTSFSPLVAWLYRSGFARFSGSRYTSHSSQINNTHIHLTNHAIQKTHENYKIFQKLQSDNGGDLKWNLRSLKLYLIAKYGNKKCNELFTEIQNVIIGSLLAVQPAMIQDKHCFELYGYDILIDNKFKVWLLEVNSMPSFSASSDEDYLIKYALINDALDIVDMEGKLKGNELQVGGFDLIYKNGFVSYHSRCQYTTKLGTLKNHIAFCSNSIFFKLKREKNIEIGCDNPALEKYQRILEKQTKKKRKINEFFLFALQ
ncbi:hypothetical protein RFI_22417 [Reticulomyxa filosa]|uniref:Tubulin--tyrosine ligase-like protein 9 n=1 Tax=Reticulomyxa filosa TaxID=46433 RepID=X6MMT1_RETFI|nr:hypothetical protein RFI_22417 [Reticulomyxa filosa]|eukprot:ETO14951.1 hypothetical protein RFI_22417 [Reticulomyxa filosa]